MNCIVAIEGRFVLRGGRPASHHLTYERFWGRYLEVFDTVTVLGRLFPREDETATPLEGPGLNFVALPPYSGPEQYVRHLRRTRRLVAGACAGESALILRVPGAVGSLAWREAAAAGRPYAVEVVADPRDVFAPGAVRHPARALFRHWVPRQLRLQCAGAAAASYVTDEALQRRYPAAPGALSVGCSDVVLPPEAIAPAPRSFGRKRGPLTLVTVGSLVQLYKAPDVLLEAAAGCAREGLDLRLVFVGDGRYREALARRAEALGVARLVSFRGQLPAGPAVREELDRSDLFVLPSRQEGLPRALIEAMARALPCIGSTVGGIPELLDADDLVAPGDAEGLKRKILEVARDPARMGAMSARNLGRAGRFREEALSRRRRDFYRHVRALTEAHFGRARATEAA